MKTQSAFYHKTIKTFETWTPIRCKVAIVVVAKARSGLASHRGYIAENTDKHPQLASCHGPTNM